MQKARRQPLRDRSPG